MIIYVPIQALCYLNKKFKKMNIEKNESRERTDILIY